MTATSVEAFRRDVYREHLDEAAFLRVRRDALRGSEETVGGVADVEAALHAHVDALRIGGRTARSLCEAALPEGDADVRFVVTLLACLECDAELLSAAVSTVRPDDAAAAAAVGSAMALAWPASWNGSLVDATQRAAAHLVPVLLGVAGYRRLDCGPRAMEALEAHPREALRAIGRVRWRDGREAVCRHLGHADPAVRFQAFVAASRLGDPRGLSTARERAPDDGVAQLALGLAGDDGDAGRLAAIAASTRGSPQAVAALGLIGDDTSWSALLALLERPALAPAAANALALIAGDAPRERHFVPERPDPDAMSASERLAWETDGTLPVRSDGRPYGTVVSRPSTRRADWERCAAERGLPLGVGVRMRGGSACDPAGAVRALARGGLHPQLRELCIEELGIRQDDGGLEHDMFVDEQDERLGALASRLREGGAGRLANGERAR